MSSRRPAPWVWIAAALVMLAMAYPLSLGPACRLVASGNVEAATVARFYAPLFRQATKKTWAGPALTFYGRLWSPEGWTISKSHHDYFYGFWDALPQP